MKCNRCGEFAEIAQQVTDCRGCQDGTAQQIPVGTPSDTPLIELAEAIPGLSNRFVPGSAPLDERPEDHQPEPEDKSEQPPAESKFAAAQGKQKPMSKRATTKKK